MVNVGGQEYPLGIGGPASTLIVFTFTMIIIAMGLVANRIVYRRKKAGHLGWDDKTIIIALYLFFLQSSIIVFATSFGYGFNSYDVDADILTRPLIAFWIYQIVYKLTINTVKISILLQFIRVFAIVWFQRCCVAMIMLCTMAAIAFTTATTLQCIPVSEVWNRTSNSFCINIDAFWTANATWNIVSDVVLLLGPIYWIIRLQVPLLKKLLVLTNFSFGIFVLVASICRLSTLHSSAHKDDPLSGTLVSTVWTQAETSVAVICTCMPMLRPLLARCVPVLRESRPPRSSEPTSGPMLPVVEPPILLEPLPAVRRRLEARLENIRPVPGKGPKGLVKREYPVPSFPYPPMGVGYYSKERLKWESSQTSLIAKSQKGGEGL